MGENFDTVNDGTGTRIVNSGQNGIQTKKKGFKAGKDIVIEGGTITFNCENDAE